MPNLINSLRKLTVPALTRAMASGGRKLLNKLVSPSSSTEQRKKALIALIDQVDQQQPGRPSQRPPTRRERQEQQRRQPEAQPEPWQPDIEEYDPTRLPAMKKVSSSNIYAVGFTAERPGAKQGTLYIQFLGGKSGHRHGPGVLYAYGDIGGGDVSIAVFHSLYKASSPGSTMWDLVRVRGSRVGSRYVYHVVGLGLEGVVPREIRLKRGQSGAFFGERKFQGKKSLLTPAMASLRGPAIDRGPGPNALRLGKSSMRQQGGR